MKHRVTSWILARWPRGGGNPSARMEVFHVMDFLGFLQLRYEIWMISLLALLSRNSGLSQSLVDKNLTQREVIGTSSAFESWSKLFRTRSEAFKSWRTCSATNSTCPTGSFPGNEGILLCRSSSATWVVYMTPSFTQNWFVISTKKIWI